MDDDESMGIRNFGFEQQWKEQLRLKLMPNSLETKPFLQNGGFLRNCTVTEQSCPMELVNGWYQHTHPHPHPRDNKIIQPIPMNHHSGYGPLPLETPVVQHTLQMMELRDRPKEERDPTTPVEEPKKRPQIRSNKPPKPKKPKKSAAPREETADYLESREKAGKNNTRLVINGIDLDISAIPTPVCSCTGNPLQCYRWGVGGWQSACCTTNMSVYPLPMNTKRRGARIAGRKMSQGAFKKVLERLAGEGYNLSNPIDLKAFWAKHGTNKFVTIR